MKLRLSKVSKAYRNGAIGVDKIDLEVEDGRMAVLLGPSGCGKTTLLRLVSGLESPDEGKIFFDKTEVTDWEPKKRDIAMVFQNYALYPHMNIKENLEFGLRARRIPRKKIDESVIWAAELLGLEEFLYRKPKELSGGQRQRVALGRAIVRKPRLYLFDEPLSNLDAELRMRMRGEILALHRKVKGTSIYVTHDQIEAMSLADIIFIMKEGKIVANGTPSGLYNNPPDLFTAGFLGFPPMNLIEGQIADSVFSSAGGLKIALQLEDSGVNSGSAVLGVRPEEISVTDEAGLSCEIVSLEHLGNRYLLLLKIPTGERLQILGRGNFKIGDKLNISMESSPKFVFDKSTGWRLFPSV